MCEYCKGDGKRIETEVDGEAYMTVNDYDPEYHADGWTIDVFDSDDKWLYSFHVPFCPMCGCSVSGDEQDKLKDAVLSDCDVILFGKTYAPISRTWELEDEMVSLNYELSQKDGLIKTMNNNRAQAEGKLRREREEIAELRRKLALEKDHDAITELEEEVELYRGKLSRVMDIIHQADLEARK